MSRRHRGDQLGLSAATALVTAVMRHLPAPFRELTPVLARTLAFGTPELARPFFAAMAPQLALDPSVRERVGHAFLALASVLPRLQGDLSDADAEAIAAECREAGELCAEIHASDMAFTLFNVADILVRAVDDPDLELARRLLDTAQPANRDQFAEAAWRFAAERLRASIDARGEWIAALDAVEFALAVPPAERVDLRRSLFLQLVDVATQTGGTPLEPVLPLVVAQAPAGSTDADAQQRVRAAMLDLAGAVEPSVPPALVQFLAAVRAQNAVDDLRVELAGLPALGPGLSWHDLSLRHARLRAAVPLGRALVADVDRTGQFALELVHEVGHAYCLLGPVGWTRMALRAAVHYLEMVLVDAAGEAGQGSATEQQPLAQLPPTPLALAVARHQRDLARRATLLEATWTPWLEGVAVYLELLCDPSESANEILAPHAVVRGLVDWDARAREGESEAAFAARYGDLSARQFELFYREALNRCSRLRHVAYAESGPAATPYLCGYLTVRSVVSRWEQTVGRRLPPVRAMKVLLDATRNGVVAALAPIDDPLETYGNTSRERLLHWIDALAALDRDVLEAVLAEVSPDDVGRRFAWHDGVPAPATPEAAVDMAGALAQIDDAALRVIFGGVDAGPAHSDAFRSLARLYRERATLLPVGFDRARLLLLDGSDRIVLCPRTYAGLQGGPEDLALQRYSIASWPAPGGEAAVSALREACARAGTARADVVRIVDMAGDPDGPFGTPGLSYVCARLGDAWSHVTIGYRSATLGDAHGAFRDRLLSRMRPMPFTAHESETLGSVAFLTDRLRAAGIDDGAIDGALDKGASVNLIGYAMCARALGVDAGVAAAAIDTALGDRAARQQIFGYLHASGRARPASQPASPASQPLAHLMMDAAAHSGITPYSEDSWRH